MTDTTTRAVITDVGTEHSVGSITTALHNAINAARKDGLNGTAAVLQDVVDGLRPDPQRDERARDRDLFYVQVTVTRPDGVWTAQRDLPTFVLDGALLGIIGGFNDPHEEVASIVRDLLMVDLHTEEGWQYSAAIRQGGSPVVEIHDLVGRRITRTIEATD